MSQINHAEALALYHAGKSDRGIAAHFGVSQNTASNWRNRAGLPPHTTRGAAKLDKAEALAMHLSGLSDSEIARHFGINQSHVTRWRQRLGRKANEPQAQLSQDKRRKARKLLREGATKQQVAAVVECHPRTVQRLRGEIAGDPRLRQTGQSIASVRRTLARDAASIMGELRHATRRMTDQTLRDDVISEMFLALMEGRLSRDQIGAEAKAYSGRAIGQWQSKWAPMSLDEDLTGEGFRLVDVIPCPSAEEWLQQVGG